MRSLDTPLPYPYNTPFSNPSDETTQFLRAFNEAQNSTARRIRLGNMWPLAEFWEDRVAKHNEVIHGYLEPIIQDALKRKEEKTMRGVQDGKSDEAEATLIDYLVEKTNGKSPATDLYLNQCSLYSFRSQAHSGRSFEYFDCRFVRGFVDPRSPLSIFAGRDTTAATLSTTIYLLAQHPHIVTRLREEILEKVGPSREPTIEDFRDMKYLRAVCNETLRLYPVVPFNMK
jgi:cytochrome P450